MPTASFWGEHVLSDEALRPIWEIAKHLQLYAHNSLLFDLADTPRLPPDRVVTPLQVAIRLRPVLGMPPSG
jgi:hypothetical protein